MQKKTHSLLETCISTAIGFGVAFVANATILPLFGFTPTLSQNFWITVFFTVVSVIRGYFVRRLFNWLHVKAYL